MSDMSQLRPPAVATAADDGALCELARSVPMRGRIAYVIEREPSFLAMTRAQGEGGKVMCMKEPNGRIVASALGAQRRVYLNGEARPILYVGDFKVHPEYRGQGIAGTVARATLEAFGEHTVAFGSVLRDNDAVMRFFGRSAELVRFHPAADVVNYTVFFGQKRGRASGVRRATAADAAQMVELFSSVHRGRQLAPALDESRPEESLTPWPGLRLNDYFVLERSDRIVAFAAAWDAYHVKQVRLLSLSPLLRGVRLGYNAAARHLSRPRLPSDGKHLRFVYVTFPCAERAEDLAEVLRGVEADYVGGEHVYFDIAFDVNDPLRHALDGFTKTSVPFRVALLTWGAHLGHVPALDGRPVYFDAALV